MKQIALLLVLMMILFILSSCSWFKTIPARPEDTNLEFWITQDVSKIDFSRYREIVGWFGAKQYYGSGYMPETDENGYEADPEYYVKYLITAWPDYADGGKYITLIEFTDPKVKLYGLTVDSSLDEFEQIFSKMRYDITKDSSQTYERISASKKGISFSLEIVNGKRKFSIRAEVTNRKGIVF
jgi:hypothetical protein